MSASSNTSDLGDWAIMTAESKDGNAVFRVRTDRPADSTTEDYIQSVLIRWNYSPDDAGCPDSPTHEVMNVFEESIDELMANNGVANLMLVTTGMGLKEWVYYTRDTEEFMRRFNDSLADKPQYPLEIGFAEDPSWDYWHQIQRKCLENQDDK